MWVCVFYLLEVLISKLLSHKDCHFQSNMNISHEYLIAIRLFVIFSLSFGL